VSAEDVDQLEGARVGSLSIRFVDTSTAHAAYLVVNPQGDVLVRVTFDAPDVFTRIDGDWYDEVDSLLRCRG
jgi:hypothetical protein